MLSISFPISSLQGETLSRRKYARRENATLLELGPLVSIVLLPTLIGSNHFSATFWVEPEAALRNPLVATFLFVMPTVSVTSAHLVVVEPAGSPVLSGGKLGGAAAYYGSRALVRAQRARGRLGSFRRF